MKRISALIDHLGKSTMASVEELGKIIVLLLSVLTWMVRPPLKAKNIFKQMEFVGVKSIFVVVLTGTFTGMVWPCNPITASGSSVQKAWWVRPWRSA
jgi:phospholipid/cholesterol/gamma-HCH transport system permease protein